MWKFILLVLLALGAYWLYVNQDELYNKAQDMFMKEKTIMRVNGASAQKQEAYEEAQRMLEGNY